MAQRTLSTKIPLAGAGTWNDAIQAGQASAAPPTILSSPGDAIVGGVFSDQSGTLFIEQSLDGGTTWDISVSRAITGGTGVSFTEFVYTPVVRIRYLNGATAQNVFRLTAKSVSSSYSS